MKICFFSPYFPQHFGGGEKHLLDVATVAAEKHDVTVAISERHLDSNKNLDAVKNKYQEFYGESLDAISFVRTPLGSSSNFLSKLLWTKQFDALYYVTDGSFFFSLAPYNFLHIQIPLTSVVVGPLQKLKLHNWQHINTNSEFTKKIVEKVWKVKVDLVLHPLVKEIPLASSEKKKSILNVGRFFKQLHSKRQDVLVDIFIKMRELQPHLLAGWKLHLVGSVEDDKYFTEVQKAASDAPIVIETNLSRKELLERYKAAAVYWHATGFGVNELENPEKVEHFGITTAEAMAAGVVPLVVAKGGQPEVLGAYADELSWNTERECIQKTTELLANPKRLQGLSTAMRKEVEQFNLEHFRQKVEGMFKI